MSINIFDTLKSLDLPAPRGILQVGASYGQELREFLERGVVNGVLVEPLKAPFDYIAAICRKLPGFVAVNALCSDVPGEVHRFHVASNAGMSSSILPPQKHTEIFGEVKFDHEAELVSTTVDDIIRHLEHNNQGPVAGALDTLYMDVQGAEFRVLMGSLWTLRRIKYIYHELIRGELYSGMMGLPSYISMMEAQGFTLNQLSFNAQHHADVLWIRRSLVGLS